MAVYGPATGSKTTTLHKPGVGRLSDQWTGIAPRRCHQSPVATSGGVESSSQPSATGGHAPRRGQRHPYTSNGGHGVLPRYNIDIWMDYDMPQPT